MSKFTAHLSHHSIGQATVYPLAASTVTAAKREARMLLGGGFRGHVIRLCEMIDGQRVDVASAIVGERGWYAAR